MSFENEKIKLLTAQQVYLFDNKGRKVKNPFCLIEGWLKTTKEKICLLSNLPAEEFRSVQITEIYKNRWQIECFFRFIKQELNFKHYFSRQWNPSDDLYFIDCPLYLPDFRAKPQTNTV